MRTLRDVTIIAGLGLFSLGTAACSGDDNTVTPSDGGSTDGTVTTDTGAPSVDSGGRDSNANQGDSAPAGDSGAADSSVADGSDGATTAAQHFVYLESNDPTTNGILAYAQASDGSLTALAGSPFATGGTGVTNPSQGLGPDDSDQELILSPDGSRLFAVNAGSDTIAVFDVNADGSLTAVAGSPFDSAGVNPVSVGLAGNFLYVVNQDGDPLKDAAASSPTYGALSVASTGALAPVANSIVAAGMTPQVALTTPDGKLLFGTDFMAPVASGQGPLRAFAINTDGTLTAAPGTPLAIPAVDGGAPPLVLGLAVNPTAKVLYAGFVTRSQIGVYTYDGTSGALTYVAEAPLTGTAPCWVRVNAAGDRVYATDTASNSVSVLDATNPLAPTETQMFPLDDPGPIFDAGGKGSLTSQAYEENLSPDGKYLFVLSQRATTDVTVSQGNVLHVLTVASDGTLSEAVHDVALPGAVGVRPQGVVVK